MNVKNDDKERDRGAPYGLRFEPRVPVFEVPLSDSQFGPRRAIGATRGTPREAAAESGGKRVISRDSEDMLLRAKRKPWLSMTALYADLGHSGYRGHKCKLELIRAGLAAEVELPANRRGRRTKLLQVTPKGTEYLESLGVRVEPKGRGGVKHLYYQKKIREWYESRGCTAEIEARVGSTTVDVLAIRPDGDRVGIEIACSPQYERTNAVKALESGIEILLFVCETEEIKNRLSNMLEGIGSRSDRMRCSVKLIDGFLGDE